MRKYLQTLLLVGALAFATGNAFGTTIAPAAGLFTASVSMPGDLLSILSIDLRSTAVLDVSNPASLGLVQSTDFAGAAPNSVIFTTNIPPSELVSLTFNTAGAIQSTNLLALTINATASALTPITDPALAALNGSFTANFAFAGSSPTDTGFVLVYNLTSIVGSDVPEPATFALMGLGLLAAGALARRSRVR